MHTGERPFEGDVCNVGFTGEGSLGLPSVTMRRNFLSTILNVFIVFIVYFACFIASTFLLTFSYLECVPSCLLVPATFLLYASCCVLLFLFFISISYFSLCCHSTHPVASRRRRPRSRLFIPVPLHHRHHPRSQLTPLLFSFFFFLSFFIFLHLFLSSIQLPNNFTKFSFDHQPFSFLSPLFQPISFPSVSKSLDSIPFAYFFHFSYLKRPSSTCFISCFHKRTSLVFLLLLAGDVEINPGPTPSTFTTLNLSHFNIRSASSITPNLDKPALLREFLIDHSIDVLTLSETWLSVDTPPPTLQSLTPQGYSIFNSPRTSGHGGGLATIYRSFLKFSKITIPTYSSFESTCSRFSIPANPSLSFILLTVYRPPSTSFPDFISHFSSLLEDLATSNSELIITGDFNIHVDQPLANLSSQFINLLHDFSLTQHINFLTHSQGHTLDLLITRSTSNILSSVSSTDPTLSDHLAILFSITVPPHLKSTRITKA